MVKVNSIENTSVLSSPESLKSIEKQANKNEKDISIWKKATAYTAGLATAEIVHQSGVSLAGQIIKHLPQPTENESKILENSFDKVMQAFKLKDKNISVVLNAGRTAFDIGDKKMLRVDANSIGKEFAIFHELGHAHNSYFGKVSKHLQKLRQIPLPTTKIGAVIMLTSSFLLTTALLTNKKEKNDGIFNKTTSFIKNNIGKIMFATTIPTLLEEAIASIKAAKVAKPFLTKNCFNRMNKNNLLCFSTYLIASIMLGVGANIGVKIRDKIVS